MKCKSDLRGAIIARRNALSPAEIAVLSRAACDHLLSLPEFVAARVVMFFITFGSEVDTLPLIRSAMDLEKRALAPRAVRSTKLLIPCEITDLDRDLAPGAYGIRAPRAGCRMAKLDEIDLILVPAAVWAEDGYRVGYGAGYYDRFLRFVPRAHRIGLGFEVQVVPQVPHDEHDLPVDMLVTERGVRRFSHRRAKGDQE
jgi:5-formyltetrahydrofolate cyclo-ligase